MTEGQPDANDVRGEVFLIMWVILMATGIVLMSQFSSALIGFIILSSSIPCAVAATYYDGLWEDDNKEVKP